MTVKKRFRGIRSEGSADQVGGKAAREGGVSDRSRPGGEKQGGFIPEGESPSFRKNMNEIVPCPCNKHGQNCFKVIVKEKVRGIRSEGSADQVGGKAAREGGDSDRSRPGGGKQGGFTPEGKPPLSVEI